MAITIPPESGGTLAAHPHHHNAPRKTPMPAQTVSSPQIQAPVPVTTPAATVAWWRCTGVTDGDTITCLDAAGQQQKVRVSDIDAPELSQPYGRESRNILADLVFGKSLAIIETGSNSNEFVTCRISVGGKDVARAMIAGGAAWVDPQSTSSYINDQQDAQKSGKGLWSDPASIPPWEHRRSAEAPWQQAT
jgi:endonuclease YncB( thermonuclease family)